MDLFTGLPTGEFAQMAFEEGFEQMLNEEVFLEPTDVNFFKGLSTPKRKKSFETNVSKTKHVPFKRKGIK